MRQTEPPEPAPRHALVQVLRAGICNTDLELLRGYYSFSGIPGHEFVGRVVSASDSFLLDRRIVGEINLACGTCRFCLRGLGRHCLQRSVLGIVRHPGAFAEYLTLPEANLHVVPPNVSDEEAVFVEPLAAACEILEQIPIEHGIEVAVLGDGKLGLLAAAVLQSAGASVTLYGRHPHKLSIASSSFCVKTAIATEAPPASRFPLTVECTGSPDGLTQAIRMTEPRGTVVMKSTIHPPVTFDSAPVIVNEISLVGSRCGRFEPAIDLLANRRIDVRPLIAAEYPLSAAPRALEHASARGTLKVLLRVSP